MKTNLKSSLTRLGIEPGSESSEKPESTLPRRFFYMSSVNAFVLGVKGLRFKFRSG